MRMEFVRIEVAIALPSLDDEGPRAIKGILFGVLLGSVCWAAIIAIIL